MTEQAVCTFWVLSHPFYKFVLQTKKTILVLIKKILVWRWHHKQIIQLIATQKQHWKLIGRSRSIKSFFNASIVRNCRCTNIYVWINDCTKFVLHLGYNQYNKVFQCMSYKERIFVPATQEQGKGTKTVLIFFRAEWPFCGKKTKKIRKWC